MSARVLNPVVFNDFHRVRSPPTYRTDFSDKKLDRIKRDLFGAPNPVEIKKLYETEIQKQQEIACKKWGFDFLKGQPLCEKTQQYIWERVTLPDFMPAMYTLTRAAHVRELPTQEPTSEEESLLDEKADRENANSSLESTLSEEDDDVIFKVPCLRSSLRIKSKTDMKLSNQSTISCLASLGKRQPKITEYMKERKRLVSATPKKLSPPSKRLRTISPCRTSTVTLSSMSSSTSAQDSGTSGRFHFRNH
ncbi:uncharacterized protein LOC129606381 [Condylostylus longicornis]|uniref:uncharacterized protein LOC129606381 n=1 Tax=Condylostylus longicornis TaxID=2530218 RepID=UPI00244E032C|nr:uncharacterized protein LOC129606381 [Condylostylus longicornis]